MAVLFIVFATAMAFGTFIESWYSTETARIWIYNTTWFELIMVFFVINFVGNIFRTMSVSREKKKLKEEILKIEDYKSTSKHVLYAKLAELKPTKSKSTWKNIFSIITFIAITCSLILYTLDLDYIIPILITTISLRHGLLLIINVYYGFRD